MKNILFFIFITLGSLITHAQSGTESTWEGNIVKRTVFIQNKGQYDNFSSSTIGEVKYAVDFGVLRIFFGEKGVSYSFLEATKMSKSARDEIMNTPVDQLPHYEKEHLIGKFNFKMDEVNMSWIGSNSEVQLLAENETKDHFSFGVKDPISQEVTNYTDIKGYTKLTYTNLYPNIDVLYEVHPESGIKYSIILHPGSDPNDVKMIYDSEANLVNGQIVIPTYFDEIIEHEPLTYYATNQNDIIASNFVKIDDVFQFNLDNYDATQKVIIDPWVQTAAGFTTSSAIWEVETDGLGNVYVIGGETPMQLKKYNSTGTLQWTYTTPWDTNSVWIGTLATDINGVSYVTSGTSPEIERINTSGGMVWHANGTGIMTEYWSITFNCDNTKLIVGGTGGGLFNYKSMIYDIDVSNGSVSASMEVGVGGQGGFSPVEVRAISSSKNAKYIFITHNQVGAINQNIGFCPNQLPIFEVNNGANLGYKCENFLPSTQNGGGLKALIANDLFFYTHAGDVLRQWNLLDGTLINTVAIPGGSANNGFGGLVVHNMGLSVDDCGNVYVGSFDRVIKYDANLNFIAEALVPFTVYDVCVNSNGEVLAVGAQGNNSVTAMGGRNGRIQSVALSTCAKFSVVCCDANFCPVGPLCETDAPVALVTTTPGGTWSGVGVDAFGVFDPSVAGIGNHPITYTLPCGTETIVISVIPCNAPIAVCEETNLTLTASGGDGTYSWYEGSSVVTSTPIGNASECTACGGTAILTFGIFYNHCEDGLGNTITDCVSTAFAWDPVPYSTSSNAPAPSTYPILIIDGVGDSLIINAASELSACVEIPLPIELKSFELTCSGSDVLCEWSTISEKDNDYFVIEKAGSDGVFEEISSIQGSMTSQSENMYQWLDRSGNNDVAYYKLSQVDLNGVSTNLQTKSINCSDARIEVYPNPFNDQLIIELGDLLLNSNGRIECVNAMGQRVINQEIGTTSSFILSTEHLSKGIYTIHITSLNVNHVDKLIKY